MVNNDNLNAFLEAMRDGDNSLGFSYSSGFWHITTISNLVKIVKNGKLIARNFNDNIPYDMRENNPITISVMSKTACESRLKQYVRLYFNPNNGVTYRFRNNDINQRIVLLEFDPKLIFKYAPHVIVTSGNANSATFEDFNWNTNDARIPAIINELSQMDFESIYSKYKIDDKDLDNLRRSEVLIFHSLNLKFYLKHIYFETAEDLNNFTRQTRSFDSNISDRYIVNSDAFKGC